MFHKNKPNPVLLKTSFLSSLGTVVYIMGVGWLIMNGEKFFGQVQNFWGPVMFLLLFVFSALITGLLVLGAPIWHYLEGKKKDAVTLLFYNVGMLFVILLIVIGTKIVTG